METEFYRLNVRCRSVFRFNINMFISLGISLSVISLAISLNVEKTVSLPVKIIILSF